MKIGSFAEKNNLTKDTIRHYMDLGLLIPRKVGGQYHFTSSNQRDLDEIIHLKSLNFTLNEIKKIFWSKKVGRLSTTSSNSLYREYYSHKLGEVQDRISSLKNVEENLKEKLEKLDSLELPPRHKIGIPIAALPLLKCLSCSSKLKIHRGSIEGDQLLQGSLRCQCGEEYPIEDGILIVDSLHSVEDFLLEDEFLSEYIQDTNEEMVDNLYKNIEWILNSLPSNSLQGKIILEPGSGVGFTLRSIQHLLDEESTYIAVDSNINCHLFLKELLERNNIQKNIIFICSDFKRMPLRDESVDVIMDFFNTSNYAFTNKTFLLDEINHLIKKDALLLGGYSIFKNFMDNSLIAPQNRRYLLWENIQPKLQELKYHPLEERSFDPIPVYGKYENFTVPGELIYSHMYLGKRLG